jgi:PST family polysaccharide transporter
MARTAPSLKSVLWASADTGGVAILSMLAMLVIARFIRPDQFGIAALASGSVLVVNLYVEGLLHDALIQRQDADDTHFRAAFWLVALIGTAVFLATLLAFLALMGTRFGPFAALLAGSAASLPFSGVIGVSTAKLRRGFHYDIVAIPSVVAKIASSVLGIGLAWHGFGAWSLVAQFVFSVVLQAALLMARQNWWPAFTLNFKPLRAYWAFALPYAGMHTIVGLRVQAFAFLIAATMGLSVAGYINVALRLTLTPQLMLQTALINLGLPMLARRQNDPETFAAAFDQFNRLVAATMTPLFIGLAASAPSVTATLLGAKWLPSVAPMQVFAVCCALYLTRMPSALLLRALGQVRYSLFNAIFHIVATVGGLLLFRPHTMLGAAFWWALPLLLILPATWGLVSLKAGVSIRQQFAGYWAPFAASGVMAAVVLAVAQAMKAFPPASVLAASVTAGAAAYVGLVLALDAPLRRMGLAVVARRSVSAVSV